MHQMYGTAYYIAPEVLSGIYTEKCDLWSIGVILYIMLSGRPPFPGKTDKEVLQKVSEGYYELTGDQWDKRSADVKDLIRKLMQRDPSKRLSASVALRHPWLERKVHNTFDVEIARETLQSLKSFHVSVY